MCNASALITMKLSVVHCYLCNILYSVMLVKAVQTHAFNGLNVLFWRLFSLSLVVFRIVKHGLLHFCWPSFVTQYAVCLMPLYERMAFYRSTFSFSVYICNLTNCFGFFVFHSIFVVYVSVKILWFHSIILFGIACCKSVVDRCI